MLYKKFLNTDFASINSLGEIIVCGSRAISTYVDGTKSPSAVRLSVFSPAFTLPGGIAKMAIEKRVLSKLLSEFFEI